VGRFRVQHDVPAMSQQSHRDPERPALHRGWAMRIEADGARRRDRQRGECVLVPQGSSGDASEFGEEMREGHGGPRTAPNIEIARSDRRLSFVTRSRAERSRTIDQRILYATSRLKSSRISKSGREIVIRVTGPLAIASVLRSERSNTAISPKQA